MYGSYLRRGTVFFAYFFRFIKKLCYDIFPLFAMDDFATDLCFETRTFAASKFTTNEVLQRAWKIQLDWGQDCSLWEETQLFRIGAFAQPGRLYRQQVTISPSKWDKSCQSLQIIDHLSWLYPRNRFAWMLLPCLQFLGWPRLFPFLYTLINSALVNDSPYDMKSAGAPRSKKKHGSSLCVILSSNVASIAHLWGRGGSLCKPVLPSRETIGGRILSTRVTSPSRK